MSEDDGFRAAALTGRGARLVALSLGGGAAITMLGTTAAHAGDAEATGNTSATDGAQTLVITPEADPTVANLSAGVANVGAGGANTGVNSGTETDIQTGNARGSGNASHSTLKQAGVASATGGGITILEQAAGIANAGAALADTGFNTGAPVTTGDADAWGNRSWTTLVQEALIDDADGAARLVVQAAAVDNLGAALAETGWNSGDEIATGKASAGGNQAETTQTQSANVTDESVGAALVEQIGRTRNRGAGAANTGFNQTTGDDSVNDPEIDD